MTLDELEQKLEDEVEKLKNLIKEISQEDLILRLETIEVRIKDLFGKSESVLTSTQKTDLTDGGATTLHKHDHGGMDGLNDNDHGAIYYTETEVDTALALKANDNAVVKLSGNQSVGGVKTHSSFPITPSSAPTTNYQTANKKYVDDSAGATYTAGSNLLPGASANTERIINYPQLTYTKRKEIIINRGGTLRVEFKTRGGTSYGGYLKVYRNGVAVGTEFSSSGYPGYETVSEDISGWSAGDLVQCYLKCYDNGNAQVCVKDFRIYVTEAIIINQD